VVKNVRYIPSPIVENDGFSIALGAVYISFYGMEKGVLHRPENSFEMEEMKKKFRV